MKWFSAKKLNPFQKKLNVILGFKPKDYRPYITAFTHVSQKESTDAGIFRSYERLEFLGDAVLSTIISDYLYSNMPKADEGSLTEMRAKIVNRKHLNEIGLDLKLSSLLMSQSDPGKMSINLHGNLFEALIGAVYLDKGYEFCARWIHKIVITRYVNLDDLKKKIVSYKSLIIEFCQKTKRSYQINCEEDTGNEQAQFFAATLKINDKTVSKARATSKKKAEEKAARRAYFSIKKIIQAENR
ncbi:MAG: ribonuclease III [Flavobacteriaceae bacterium]|nr:ribonuclease III [Flavobacteriaceae bacterium]